MKYSNILMFVKLVKLLSRNCNPVAPLSSVSCKQKDGTSNDVQCPIAVQECNNYMNGVDDNDHLHAV